MQKSNDLLEKRIDEFVNDDSYMKDYDWFLPMKSNHVLVRVFKFSPGDNGGDVLTRMVMLPDEQGVFKPAREVMESQIMPLCKVISHTCEEFHEDDLVGQVCIVEAGEVTGEVDNPDFLHLLQFTKAKGMDPIIPEGMKKKIPAIERNWLRYNVKKPWNLNPDDQDRLTYFVPISKIQAIYDPA